MLLQFFTNVLQTKCSIDQNAKLSNSLPLSPVKSYYWNIFLRPCNNFSEQNCLDKPVFNDVALHKK